ncbi:tyrosine-type recombinase/integrase [Silicimonas algicola]|uniref:Phage integrase family protein n=1 Tax=Silicimonas algicola TaxID=1826607 RepID=A0A316G3Y3_9RHOB|nr:phage integrase family protein [Silicimonas algicola]
MTWAEYDTAEKVWTISGKRMKAGADHRVPLSPAAVALLNDMERFEGTDLVFPAPRGGQLSDMALSATMRRINEAREGGYLDARSQRPAVPHGLRSTFRDWAAERGYPRDMAEIALAHTVGSEVERAYRRTDMLERRRAMMDAWAGFLSGEACGKVVRIGA